MHTMTETASMGYTAPAPAPAVTPGAYSPAPATSVMQEVVQTAGAMPAPAPQVMQPQNPQYAPAPVVISEPAQTTEPIPVAHEMDTPPVSSNESESVEITADESEEQADAKGSVLPFEIFTHENLKKAMMRIYGGTSSFDAEFTAGLLAFYENAKLAEKFGSMEEIRKQIDHPDNPNQTIYGWHAAHVCLACLSGSDLLQYVESLQKNYSIDEWKALNKPANSAIGLLHALAMNPDHDAAINAYHTLTNVQGWEWYHGGGYLGLLPTHMAVINGAYDLADAMKPMFCNEAGEEIQTQCLINSSSLKDIFQGRRAIEPADLNRWKHPHPSNSAQRNKMYGIIKCKEKNLQQKLKTALAKAKFREKTAILPLPSRMRPSNQWIAGLSLAMLPNPYSWNQFHFAVTDPECKIDKLNELKENDAAMFSKKDSQGRTPLFYALAYGSKEIITWCLQNAGELNLNAEVDVYGRSLVYALSMNDKANELSEFVGELIREYELEKDVFGIYPFTYAVVNGQAKLAEQIYKESLHYSAGSVDSKKAMWQKYKDATNPLGNADINAFLKQNVPTVSRDSWDVFTGLF